MDEWLAQVYGTDAGTDVDLEKTAQAVMLNELAEEEGVDLSGLSEEDLEALADEVLASEGQPDDANDITKEAEAKFAEADFLGRVMAHAYSQELRKLAGVGATVKEISKAVANAGRSARKTIEGAARRGGELLAGGRKNPAFAGKMRGQRPGNHPFRRGPGGAWGREGLKSTAARLGLLGTGVAIEEGVRRSLKKQASAFDALAERRALEILEGSGVDFTEKTANDAAIEQFNTALEQRAYQMLQQAGYVD